MGGGGDQSWEILNKVQLFFPLNSAELRMAPPAAPLWKEKEAPASQPAGRKVSRKGRRRAAQQDRESFAATSAEIYFQRLREGVTVCSGPSVLGFEVTGRSKSFTSNKQGDSAVQSQSDAPPPKKKPLWESLVWNCFFFFVFLSSVKIWFKPGLFIYLFILF